MSSRPTFGTVKRVIAILIAIVIVLAAGIIVGQAPALFGVDEAPEAAIEFEDQQSNGTAVTIDEVYLSDGGFVVITGGDGPGEPIAVSEQLGSGTHEDVTIERDEGVDQELLGQLTATAHQNTAEEDSFAYVETDGEEDQPYLSAGYPVSDTATVTSAETDDSLEDSFAVESIDAPRSATTNETINVSADIRNPTDLDAQQTVELRLDGELLEWQTLDLEGGEVTTVSFEINTRGAAPGERSLGVYTDRDGVIETIDLEFHTEPSVEITDASENRIIADVATPTEGFVAIEDEGGDVIGASERLEPGEHEDVRVSVDENASVDEEAELTAVIYEGDPADREAASAYERDGEDDPDRVETTFTIADESAEPSTDAE